jgi:hypothetical protein
LLLSRIAPRTFSTLTLVTALSATVAPAEPLVIAEWSLLDAPVTTEAELVVSTSCSLPPPAEVPIPAPEYSEPLPPVLVAPNADGLIDLATLNLPEAGEALPNPFRIRWHPPTTTREAILTVESVLVQNRADSACVCINGRIFSLGETIEGLTLIAISDDALELRRGRLTVRCPIGDQPLRLTLPRL